MSILPETLTLTKASIYTNPQNEADPLPRVYGDLTDGAEGIWKLPLIDSVNHVYAYAGHETLSAANGNSVTVYVDGVASGGVTFSESNNYESQGTISTVTFTGAQGNAVVTARGKGAPTASAGATLMDNPIDIIDDALVAAGFNTTYYDSTAKAVASAKAVSQGYTGAGVIVKDIAVWKLLQEILASFNPPQTNSYINQAGLLALNIDDGTVDAAPGVTRIDLSDFVFYEAEHRLDDLLNQFEGNYRYNFTGSFFSAVTSSVSDAGSMSTFGTRQPEKPFEFKWMRTSAGVTTVLNIILARFKQPLWVVKCRDSSMKRITLDVGDNVLASVKDLYDNLGNQLVNEIWKILSITPDRQGLELSLLDTGTFFGSTALYNGDDNYDGSIQYGGARDTSPF